MSKLSPKDLRTKQVISTSRLLSTAEHYGFITRRPKGGSTHVICKHSTYPDITCNIICNNGKLGSQHSLADAILELQRREAAAIASLKSTFAKAADKNFAERLMAIQEQLPDYAEAFYGDNQDIIVRDNQTPQIGFTLHSATEDHLLENKLRHELDAMKREFNILLRRCHMEYDMRIDRDPKGNFTGHVGHYVYDMDPVFLPPYPEASEPISALLEIQERVLEIDLDHVSRKETILSKPFISDTIFVSYNARRGTRHNHIRYQDNDGRLTLSLEFQSFSNQRAQGNGSVARITENELLRIETAVAAIEKTRGKDQKHQAA